MGKFWVFVLVAGIFIAVINKLCIEDPVYESCTENLPQLNLDMKVGNVTTEDGKLAYSGYLTSPTLKWDPSIFEHNWRFKQWEFYGIYADNITLAVATVDLGYVKNVFITIYEKGKDPVTIEEIVPFWVPSNMTQDSLKGTTRFNTTNFFMFFHNNGKDMKTVVANYKKTEIDINLIFVKGKHQEGMVYLGPMNDDGSKFFYSHKQYNYLVDGYLTYNGKNHLFSKQLGVMDWGRGIWPYHSRWIWASGLGVHKGVYLGLNIGELPGKNHYATDDCLFANETVIKIGVVNTQHPKNLLDPWVFTTVNDRPHPNYAFMNMTFYPEKVFEKSFSVWVIKSDLKQLFGTYKGIVRTTEYEVEVVVRGFMEVHHARW
ncbi:unnamed protein product [Blepharisma stoltei]|uniref:AttH domain-containing protein n=1 Tax=Blepharisma stoltei TaxID=1481888 RepID=A0AAU9JU37_9CILI|nr:unnamed protein product [Blepharisma stoltei]